MKRLYCLLAWLIISVSAFAQNDIPDSAFYARSVSNAEACYKYVAGAGLKLYNGVQYNAFVPRTNGHPYFISDSLLSSSILYDGVLYQDVKMKYDLVDEKLILYNYAANFLFCPGKEKISQFTIGGHFFENVSMPMTGMQLPVNGFFEKIFSGSNVNVYVKWEKKLLQPVRAEDTLAFYRQYKTNYISKNGELYEIAGKKSLYKVMEDKKQEIRSYIAGKGITGLDDKNLPLIASYYESLKQ